MFLQVWRRAADFDENRGRPFTWLVTLARSRGIDRLRSLASRERTAVAGANERPEEVSDAASDDQVGTSRRGEQRSCGSPRRTKAAVDARLFDGLTQSEIATKLGVPLGTVKTRMRTGMMKLREAFGKSSYFGTGSGCN